MERRDLLTAAGFAVVGLAGRKALAAGGRDVIVCVFQRGAMDGLSVVVPFGDSSYYDLRPTIAIGEPGGGGGAIDLDGFFGLHPAAASLEPFFRSGQLAMVHASGATQADRSHFNAQSLMERGINNVTGVYSGWFGRHLEATHGGVPGLRGVSIASALDQALAGSSSSAAIANSANFSIQSRFGDAWRVELGRPYAQATPLGETAQGTLGVMDKLVTEKPFELPPENGAAYPASAFGGLMQQAAQYIKADIGVEAICVNIGGWDHHAAANQSMPGVLGDFANGVAAFATDLGTRMQNVTLISMSEFGRRAQENASAGTDHGRGNVMFTLGGGVHGGRVYGRWPGLRPSDLEDGDLAITTDYRSVLAEMLARRAGNTRLAETFPGFGEGTPLGIFARR